MCLFSLNIQVRCIHLDRKVSGCRGRGVMTVSQEEVPLGAREMFWKQTEVVAAQRRPCAKCHSSSHFHTVNFVLCAFSSVQENYVA